MDARVDLTEREQKIIALLCDGKTNAEVADALGLAPRTAETYRLRLMKRLGIPHLPALVKYALKRGLTALD